MAEMRYDELWNNVPGGHSWHRWLRSVVAAIVRRELARAVAVKQRMYSNTLHGNGQSKKPLFHARRYDPVGLESLPYLAFRRAHSLS